MPDELANWVKRVCADFGLWLVIWPVGRNADQIKPEDLHPSQFSGDDDALHLFLGDPALCPQPKWRVVNDRRELDFPRSYAVQLVPSLLAKNGKTLLQGRLAIMREADYSDPQSYAGLRMFFRRLKSELKRRSDANHVIVQPLSGGGSKRWSDILVSTAVIRSAKTLSLKQFSRGAVEFRIEPK